MYKKIISAIMSVVLIISSCACVFAATKKTEASDTASVTVSITVGVGETKSLDDYMKEGAAVDKWTNSATAVVRVSGTKITGLKEGKAVIKGKSNGVSYEFNIKVLKNFTGYQNLENKTNKNEMKNSRGETIKRYERNISMGVKDSISVTNLLESKKKYSNYSWSFSDKGIISFKNGKITALKNGMTKITASDMKNIYVFYITVSDKWVAKNIRVSKETLTNLGNIVGDDYKNYVYKATSMTGSAVSVKDNTYIASAKTTGTSIVTAESTTGGTNYTLIVTIN